MSGIDNVPFCVASGILSVDSADRLANISRLREVILDQTAPCGLPIRRLGIAPPDQRTFRRSATAWMERHVDYREGASKGLQTMLMLPPYA